MIVRIFSGGSWIEAAEAGDYDFDMLPRIGEKIAIGLADGWQVGAVVDIVHRSMGGGAADVALLAGPLRSVTGGMDPLPFEALDDTRAGKPAALKSPWR